MVALLMPITFSFLDTIKAPEVIKGEVVGPPADVWSIGVITYNM